MLKKINDISERVIVFLVMVTIKYFYLQRITILNQ
nr:MAG TPA: hypothetical protein [Caudoviricetes sp.]